ncbi:hypothetical protein [Maribellus maritimus]|uniref:hypothetical protein n=1 Tax=Maribellus maritimus TaxID=2870838 RepID=UPI001EEBA076|nr:hypothetical protein [Maribellus maritimus]MCG6189687.1 hypothetical protein [Maribellus maritimus]
MEYIRKNIKFIFLLVIPVYFSIIQNSILNKHTHFCSNGIVVTHSHPINKEDGKPINNHKHTKTEICFFHCFHFDSFTIPEEISFQNNECFKPYRYFISNDKVENFIIYLDSSPRAPPYLIV